MFGFWSFGSLSVAPLRLLSFHYGWSRGQQFQQRHPDFPLPRHLVQLFWGKPKVFPGQPGDKATLACPGPPPSEKCVKHLPREVSRGPSKQMSEPPQLIPLDVEE
ncbi:hypothetical protein ILYODFUR_030042 [Ilyodon furcidens]|uniref:Secreted protein n=1 Tax=Ilyodon furcidens TaxID=33524 RepID=A0ABV0STW4_9TELE